MDGAVEPVGTSGAIAIAGERRVWKR
jgi:hypothetical protein